MGLYLQCCGLQQLGFWCFPPSAATDFSQRQLTFAKMVEVEKEKQTFVFWLSLCTQAVLETTPGSLFPASNHFPTGQAPGCLDTFLSGTKTASPLCTHQEQQEAGTACFSSNRTGDPSAPALQRDSWGLLWTLATPSFHFVAPWLQASALHEAAR